jgi:chromosome partitioning protein
MTTPPAQINSTDQGAAPNRQATTAKIIVVYNDKGGSGKTTTTCNLAGTLGLRGYDVLVADLDPTQTSASWLAKSGGENFKATIWPGFRYGSNVASELEKLIHKYEIIVVDCPPSVENPSTWATLLVADLAIIATKIGPTDMNGLPAAKNLAKQAREKSMRNFPVYVVPNSTQMHRRDDQSAMNAILRDQQFPCFMQTIQVPVDTPAKGQPKSVEKLVPLTLGNRTAFTRPMLIGGTAHSIRNSNEAVSEIELLTDKVLSTLQLPFQR